LTYFFKAQIKTLDLDEFEALARGLDTQKELAKAAFDIHKTATRVHEDSHDPEVCISTTYPTLTAMGL
jgi:hypothetical protein